MLSMTKMLEGNFSCSKQYSVVFSYKAAEADMEFAGR